MSSSANSRDFSNLFPYDQLIACIQALFDLLHKVYSTVIDLYGQIRPDIVQYCWNVDNSQEQSPQAVDTVRRVLTNLLNVIKFFNPRRFAAFVPGEDFAYSKDEPFSAIQQLVGHTSRMVEHIIERSSSLLSEIRPLMDRVGRTIPQLDEPLWNDLLDYQTRLLAFTLDVLNPALFAHLEE